MASSQDHLKYMNLAVEAAAIGRDVVMKYFGQLRNVKEKRDAGLVSEADQESEDRIREFLASKTPEFQFLGEEGGQTNPKGASEGRWICDPLDGTTNYIHKFPFFCVSIGLELEGKIVAGAVDVPCMDQVYKANLGGGAFLNNEKIQVSRVSEMSEGLFVTGFSYKRGEELDQQTSAFLNLMQHARGVRRTGSAAIDLCLVASGVFDGYWERHLNPWDTAAGALLVEEAGGLVSDFSGNNYDPFGSEVLAAGPHLHKKLQDVLKPKSNS